jgi:hypothetical protein
MGWDYGKKKIKGRTERVFHRDRVVKVNAYVDSANVLEGDDEDCV